MENDSLIKSFLITEFHLSDKETKIYLCLAKYGDSTVIELANITGLNRTTTHINVESLTQKGLITQLRKGRGSRRLIMAEPTEKLALLLKNQKTKIETAEKQLPTIMQQLQNLKEQNLQNNITEIRRYRGKDEVRLIYEDVLKACEIRTYANIDDMLKIFPENVDLFVNAHHKNKNMYIWEIMKDSQTNRNYIAQMVPERFSCRLVTDSLELPPTDYFIFDEKVAVIEIVNGVISGIVIENKNFYSSSRAIHRFVWNYLPNNEG